MYFSSLQELLAMGGHGPYVWSAYAIGLGVMLGLAIVPWRRHAQQKKDLLRQANP